MFVLCVCSKTREHVMHLLLILLMCLLHTVIERGEKRKRWEGNIYAGNMKLNTFFPHRQSQAFLVVQWNSQHNALIAKDSQSKYFLYIHSVRRLIRDINETLAYDLMSCLLQMYYPVVCCIMKAESAEICSSDLPTHCRTEC